MLLHHTAMPRKVHHKSTMASYGLSSRVRLCYILHCMLVARQPDDALVQMEAMSIHVAAVEA